MPARPRASLWPGVVERTHASAGEWLAAVRAGRWDEHRQEPPQGSRFPPRPTSSSRRVHLLLSVGFARTGLTGEEDIEVDLVQTEQAIEAVRALMPVLERLLPPEALLEYRQALADLQMAYSRGLEAPAPGTRPPRRSRRPVVEPAQRPKIWTPRGDV